jgi:hypothetical protein
MSQVYGLLRGIYVLPYIGESMKPNQQELRFRRLHLLHALWETKLAEVQIRMDDESDEDIAKELQGEIGAVLRDAKQKRPDTTREDVTNSLYEVLDFWDAGSIDQEES